jgi:hypothetical protein
VVVEFVPGDMEGEPTYGAAVTIDATTTKPGARRQPAQPVVFHQSADAVRAQPRYKVRLVIDAAALQIVLMALIGWLDRRQRQPSRT